MIIIQDNVIPDENIAEIRLSTFESGFGAWTPAKKDFGYSEYKGMNWKGFHGALHIALYNLMQKPIFPNQSFFKISTKDDNSRLIHSDRNDGAHTAIVYLSEHEDISGTGFYRHIETGKTIMPTFFDMMEEGTVDYWNKATKDETQWEQTDFVRGLKGRMLVFDAPLFHGRIPHHGIGDTPENARMIWVCHFFMEGDF
jgi:hypothetical protein